MDKYFQFINVAAVGFAIFTFLLIISYNFIYGIQNKLDDILVRVLAASAIPTSIALLLCSFDPSLLKHMIGFNIHIATAGLALLFISVKGIMKNTKYDENSKPIEDSKKINVKG